MKKPTNVVPLRSLSATDHPLLVAFVQSKRFAEFLEALKESICGGIDSSDLRKVFKKAAPKIRGPIDWRAFQDTIANIEFKVVASASEKLSIQDNATIHAPSIEEDERKKVVQQHVQSIFQKIKREQTYRDKLNATENHYFQFMPALEIREALETDFPGDSNPGITIGKYMRALFSSPSVEPSAVKYVEFNGLSILVRDVIAWGLARANSAQKVRKAPSASEGLDSLVVLSLAYIFCTGQHLGPKVGGKAAQVKADFALNHILKWSHGLSQGMFERVLDHWDRSPASCKSATPFLLIAQLPYGAPYASSDEAESGMLRGSNRLADPRLFKSLPYVRWDYLDLIQRQCTDALDDEKTLTEAVSAAYRLLVEKYHRARSDWAGYSPLGLNKAWELNQRHAMWNGGNADDVALQLSLAADLFNESHPFGLRWVTQTKNNELSAVELHNRLEERANYFLDAVDAALGDNLQELSSALLGFFLYSQGIAGKGEFAVAWRRLGSVISQHLGKPGEEVLRRCGRIAADRAEVKGRPLEAMQLRALLGRGAADVRLIYTNDVVPVNPLAVNCRAKLLGEFGQDALEKLSIDGLNFLVDAEVHWEKLASGIGRDASDFSSLGIAYAKPIEAALIAKLERAYQLPEYQEFCRTERMTEAPTTPSLGPIFYMLKDFKVLPEAVRLAIESSGVKLHSDSDFLLQLRTTFDLRNKAGHEKKFASKDIVHLRDLLFNGGFLRRFLTLL
jgi:hypothetical protein